VTYDEDNLLYIVLIPHSCSISSSVISQRLLSNFFCNEATDIKLNNCTFSTSATRCSPPSDSFAGIQCSSSASGEVSWCVSFCSLYSCADPSFPLPSHPIPSSPLSLLTVSAGSIRLFGGSTRRGIVEVFYDGRWGPVCSSSWGSSDARVVCGELGFNRNDASSYTSNG